MLSEIFIHLLLVEINMKSPSHLSFLRNGKYTLLINYYFPTLSDCIFFNLELHVEIQNYKNMTVILSVGKNFCKIDRID